MKAVVLEKPGHFRMAEVESPSTPKSGEALVRIRRVGVCGTDLHAFKGEQPFFTYPRILGHELSGEIVEIEDNDLGLTVGDRCAIEPYLNCGHCAACRRGKPNCCENLNLLGVHSDGGMQEEMVVPAAKLHKSEILSFDQLALTEMLSIGAHAVRRASLAPDDDVLIVGVGPIGLAVLEFVRLAGIQVKVMDVKPARLDYCRETLKVSHCLETNGNAISELREINNGNLPTVVFDCTGNPKSMMNSFKYLAHGAKLIFVGLHLGAITFEDPYFHSHEISLLSSRNATNHDFRQVLHLMEADLINPDRWITHRVTHDCVATALPQWSKGDENFRKAIVEW